MGIARIRPIKTRSLAAVLAATALLAGAAGASPGGSLDTSFGNGGSATIDFGVGEYLQAAVVQRDGKIVAGGAMGAGQTNSGLLVRLTADGKLDASFDADGRVVVARAAYRGAVALQRDGKVLFAGGNGEFDSSGMNIVLTRFNPDGSVDGTFGDGGRVETDVDNRYDMPYHVLVAPDGRILVVGQTIAGSNSDVVVLRYDAGGRLDTSFGSGGKAISDWGNFDVPAGAALAPDGAIVVGGFREEPTGQNPVVTVERFTAGGRPDASFGRDGIVVSGRDAWNAAGGVAVQADGKVVVAAGDKLGVLRLTRSGAPDPSFGRSGLVTLSTASQAVARDVAVQPNGKIVVFGVVDTTGGHDVFVLKRLLPTGAVDRSFADSTPAFAANAYAEAVGVAPDGRILGVGWTWSPDGPGDAVVLRYGAGTCSVPQLAGKTVAVARARLVAANCRLGAVKNVASKRARKGTVIAQRPVAGREAADWALVDLTVSRGR